MLIRDKHAFYLLEKCSWRLEEVELLNSDSLDNVDPTELKISARDFGDLGLNQVGREMRVSVGFCSIFL